MLKLLFIALRSPSLFILLLYLHVYTSCSFRCEKYIQCLPSFLTALVFTEGSPRTKCSELGRGSPHPSSLPQPRPLSTPLYHPRPTAPSLLPPAPPHQLPAHNHRRFPSPIIPHPLPAPLPLQLHSHLAHYHPSLTLPPLHPLPTHSPPQHTHPPLHPLPALPYQPQTLPNHRVLMSECIVTMGNLSLL